MRRCVAGTAERGVARRADLGHVDLEVGDLVECLLHGAGVIVTQLYPRAARRLHLHERDPGVDIGEQLDPGAEHAVQRHHHHEKGHHPAERGRAVPERPFQNRLIAPDPQLHQPVAQALALLRLVRHPHEVRAQHRVEHERHEQATTTT